MVCVAVYSARMTTAARTPAGGVGTPRRLYVVPEILAKIAVFRFWPARRLGSALPRPKMIVETRHVKD